MNLSRSLVAYQYLGIVLPPAVFIIAPVRWHFAALKCMHISSSIQLSC
jgi:hypothetical protein